MDRNKIHNPAGQLASPIENKHNHTATKVEPSHVHGGASYFTKSKNFLVKLGSSLVN